MNLVTRIEMKVREDGADILSYTFSNLSEASEMLAFLKDFLPEATFVIQPLRH